MKRRILLVDDDLAVLLTLKAVLELRGFEVETASTSADAFARLQSAEYHMVISDLRMETEDAGLEVLRVARCQPYDPATALLTAYPPSEEYWLQKNANGLPSEAEAWGAESADSFLVKPLGTGDLLRQVEALLVRHADRKLGRQNAAAKAQNTTRQTG